MTPPCEADLGQDFRRLIERRRLGDLRAAGQVDDSKRRSRCAGGGCIDDARLDASGGTDGRGNRDGHGRGSSQPANVTLSEGKAVIRLAATVVLEVGQRIEIVLG
jgi:hypothetical protein